MGFYLVEGMGMCHDLGILFRDFGILMGGYSVETNYLGKSANLG